MIDGAILPNLDQCGSYIECRSRMVVNRECESGKLFDLTLMYCIPNFAVECGTRKDNSVKIEITPPRSPIIGQTPAVINPARPSPGPQRPNSPEQIAQNSVILNIIFNFILIKFFL